MGAEYEHEASGRSLQGPCRRPFAESSETIRYRVIAARNIQLRRFFDEQVYSNAQMGPRLIRKYYMLRPDCERIMEDAVTKLGFFRACLRPDSQEKPNNRLRSRSRISESFGT